MSNSPPVKNSFDDVPPPSNDPPPPTNVPIPINDTQTPPLLNFTVPKMKDIAPPSKEWQRIPLPTDVLMLTVKDEEFLAIYAYLGNVFKSHHKNLGRVYFGEMGDGQKKVKISLLRCTEGATEVGGSQNVVRNGVSVLQPKAVICVGFCGGLNSQKTKLGDVVISLKLSTYAHKKVSGSKRPERRGVTANVSKNMGNLIKFAADGWNAPLTNPEALDVTIHRDKEILSGPELCNDDTRRRELLDENPNAIAIEMEGEGVYAAAFDLQIEWAIIKGISDYADGTKSNTKAWQSFASVMAASVVHNMLKEPDVLADWPHYRGTEERNSNGERTTEDKGRQETPLYQTL